METFLSTLDECSQEASDILCHILKPRCNILVKATAADDVGGVVQIMFRLRYNQENLQQLHHPLKEIGLHGQLQLA
jgi:hypothetical protein